MGILLLRALPRSICNLLLLAARHMPTFAGVALRYMLVVRLAKKCGRCVAVFEGVYLRGLAEIEFGDNVSVHPMAYIEGAGGISIGSDVSIAHGVTIMSVEHDFSEPGLPTRDSPLQYAPVHIGDDVWLGAGVRVLGGVRIASGAVVGAGAVVTHDIPTQCVAAGVPARIIRERTKLVGPNPRKLAG